MSDEKVERRTCTIALEYEFDAPPQKVWRAISTPGLRERWLPTGALAEPEATSLTPGREVSYRMRDEAPPFLESIVTFKIASNAAGGTRLRIIHALDDARLDETTRTPANSNNPLLMRAA